MVYEVSDGAAGKLQIHGIARLESLLGTLILLL